MNTKYTPEQKQQILNRYLLYGEKPTDIIRSTGIAKSTFFRWVKEGKLLQDDGMKKIVNMQDYRRLVSRVERLETIIKIIRETKISSASPLAERLSAAEKITRQYSVHIICEALDIARGTYYNHMIIPSSNPFLRRSKERNYIGTSTNPKKNYIKQSMNTFFITTPCGLILDCNTKLPHKKKRNMPVNSRHFCLSNETVSVRIHCFKFF